MSPESYENFVRRIRVSITGSAGSISVWLDPMPLVSIEDRPVLLNEIRTVLSSFVHRPDDEETRHFISGDILRTLFEAAERGMLVDPQYGRGRMLVPLLQVAEPAQTIRPQTSPPFDQADLERRRAYVAAHTHARPRRQSVPPTVEEQAQVARVMSDIFRSGPITAPAVEASLYTSPAGVQRNSPETAMREAMDLASARERIRTIDDLHQRGLISRESALSMIGEIEGIPPEETPLEFEQRRVASLRRMAEIEARERQTILRVTPLSSTHQATHQAAERTAEPFPPATDFGRKLDFEE